MSWPQKYWKVAVTVTVIEGGNENGSESESESAIVIEIVVVPVDVGVFVVGIECAIGKVLKVGNDCECPALHYALHY